MKVYFIRPVGMLGPIKIGCSRLTSDRLAALTVWSPFPLEIAAEIEGDFVLERRFHAKFRELHSHSEWFRHADQIDADIRAINSGTFDVETLPEPKALTSARRTAGWTPQQKMGASLNARIRALKKTGVEVPGAVRSAAFRYSGEHWCGGYDPHKEDDARLVQQFLSQHGYAARPLPSAANDATSQDRAA